MSVFVPVSIRFSEVASLVGVLLFFVDDFRVLLVFKRKKEKRRELERDFGVS